MDTPQDPYAGLRAQLEKMEWPAIFPFKFIVPLEKLDEVYQLFSKQDTTTRMSRHGNYASVTATPFMLNPDKVIEVYQKAESIEGLTAL
jgi:putative lipoic acid-binding regulatory protein